MRKLCLLLLLPFCLFAHATEPYEGSVFSYLWHTLITGKPGHIDRKPVDIAKKGIIINTAFHAPKECSYYFNLLLIHQQNRPNEYKHLTYDRNVTPTRLSWGDFKVTILKFNDANVSSELIFEDTVKVRSTGRSHKHTYGEILFKSLPKGKYQLIVEKLTEEPRFSGIPTEFLITTLHRKV